MEAMAVLAEQTERDFSIFVRKCREIRHTYQDLERKGDIPRIQSNGFESPDEDDLGDGQEALDCEACGEVWVREVKRGRKPKTCPECRT